MYCTYTYSNDVTDISALMLQAVKSILTNKAAIAINQEYAGNAGDRLIKDGPIEVIERFPLLCVEL